MLHSFEEFGSGFLRDLNGTFACAVYNRSTGELILANDTFGIYPLFVYETGHHFFFCTEYEPITKYGNISQDLDYDAIAEFFALGLPLGDKTFFKNLSNLQKGSILKISPEGTFLKRYDDLDIRLDRCGDISRYSRRIAASVHRSVSNRIENTDHLVCRLSGGADTRLILSNIPKETRKRILFQTERSRFVPEDRDRDVIIAKKIAEKLGLNHGTYFPPKPVYYDEKGFGPDFFPARRASSSFKPLGGWHGSQFLGGICFTMCPIKPRDLTRRTIRRRLKWIFTRDFIERISDPLRTAEDILENARADNSWLEFVIQQLTRGFFTNIFRGSRSGWLDPYSFPTRFDTVFWDKEFLKAILTVPGEYIAGYRLYNHVYKNHFPELIDIPTNSPLAERSDSCLPLMREGVEPKKARRPQYMHAFKSFMKAPRTWEKGFYSPRFRHELRSRLMTRRLIPKYQAENNTSVAAFIDFEAWHRHFSPSP